MRVARTEGKRRYALVRLEAGDYLLPANDGATLWRISTYTDGPSLGLDEWPRDREFWGAWKYIGRVRWAGDLDLDRLEALLDWNDWTGPVDSYLETRREAIVSALKA